MSSPVVIQGTAVKETTASPFGVSSGNPYGDDDTNNNHQQASKQTTCNDPLFVVAFFMAAVGITATAAIYSPGAFAGFSTDSSNTTDSDSSNEFSGYIVVATAIACLSFVGAGLGMAVLMCIPQFLIKVSLIFSTALAGIMAVYSLMNGQYLAGGIGALFFAISVCYACMVWKRIPFATANLVTGITAIRKNLCIALVAYIFTVLGVAWSIIWSLAMLGVNQNAKEDCVVTETETCSVNGGYTFLLLLALYFVQQVIQNSVHVTVAGTVATWWYSPQESGCGTVCNSFIRTVTTSFGSICFGSLLVAIIQALKQMARQSQEDGECNALACVAQCILGCIEGIVEYFNKWAFVYVGIYGMNYIQAGKSVFELFKSRGWEAIIADDLVGNALLLVSLIVGVFMGGVAAALEATIDQIEDTEGLDSRVVAFLLGLVIGLVVTSILMSTIASAVNAVIVLFAEGPREFEQNHPELSRKMREVWAATYPGVI